MREAEIFEATDRALGAVVDQIKDDQWDLPLPDRLKWWDTHRVLRDLIAHHASDEAWVPDVLAGRSAEEVGDRHAGDLLGDHPKAAFTRLIDVAVDAVRALDDPDRTVHLSYGDFPATVYLQHISIFRGMGAYDIAELIGADTTLPDDAVRGLWEIIEPQAEELRAMGVFGPEVEVADDAPLQARLLGLAGLRPHS